MGQRPTRKELLKQLTELQKNYDDLNVSFMKAKDNDLFLHGAIENLRQQIKGLKVEVAHHELKERAYDEECNFWERKAKQLTRDYIKQGYLSESQLTENPDEGPLGGWTLAGVETGRVFCSEPNLSGVPKEEPSRA
jgi:hypothetical protein